jgi:hypothetical protein
VGTDEKDMENMNMYNKLLMSVALVVATLSGIAVGAQPLRLSSPISVHTQQGFDGLDASSTRLHIDGFDMDLSGKGQAVIIEDFPLDAFRSVTLELTTFSVLTEDARLIETHFNRAGKPVDKELAWTKVALFHGKVMGEADSEVFLGIGGGLANGWINVNGTRFFIGTNPNEDLTVIFDEKNVPELVNDFYAYTCNTDTKDAHSVPDGSGYRAHLGLCNQVWIAFDTDNELLEKFAGAPVGDTVAANAYIQMLVGTVSSTLYEPLLDVKLVIPFLRFWSGLDPWNAVNTDGQLAEFSLYWNINETDVERGLAQLISGRQLGGGIASLSSICTTYGYAVLGGIYNQGNPWYPPLVRGRNNWDPIVFAHETGHNFGMIHTFDFADPIDECGEECDDYDPTSDDFLCADYVSTIMSYCHLCPPNEWCIGPDADGTPGNIRIEFAYENIIRAEGVLENLPCTLWTDEAGPPTVVDDFGETTRGTPITFIVLSNDSSNDCTELEIIDFMSVSVRGGSIFQADNASLTYTPRGNMTGADSFLYWAATQVYNEPVVGTVVINVTGRPSGGGATDIGDVIFVISVWGTARADWNGDGVTDKEDLLAVIQGKFKPNRP